MKPYPCIPIEAGRQLPHGPVRPRLLAPFGKYSQISVAALNDAVKSGARVDNLKPESPI
ncbi:unnamed protein product [marine sediment metagenome]|uniref:Uncharacterized protein n=1 Tax=marine sediment metagenome TaxID=412755 RepID=X1GCE0_9ZZZZ